MAKDFAQIVARAATLRANAKALEDEANELLDSLGPLAIDNYVAGDYILQVQPNRRFDPVLARKNLDPALYESILVPTPNSALAKKTLSDEEYASAQREYEPKRVIKRVTDVEV